MTGLGAAERACVIGAGSSGIACCQVLCSRGIPFDCFEVGSGVGGNWRYMNDNGMSAAYRSLHANTSRDHMAFAALPMPRTYPDYPDHFAIARYFDAYVDHFGFRDRIRFRSEVARVVPAGERGYDVTTRSLETGEEETSRYAAVLVATGHHWLPQWPDPAFPGAGEFTGEQIHAHDYKTPDLLRDKRLLVLGAGNSACDIAVEGSLVSSRTFLAMRSGAYVLPKYLLGRPLDETNTPLLWRLPLWVQRLLLGFALRVAVGRMSDYGLPEPDHKLLQAHPTISSDLLPRIGHGEVEVKPNVDAFVGGNRVRFADGSDEEIDLVVYCTGYRISFPFFEEGFVSAPDNRIPLYRRVVDLDHAGLYFIGLVQPVGAIMPLAEVQAAWVADLLEGKAELPRPSVMRRVVARDDARMTRRYVASRRHTIQVDFHPYLRTIRRERRVGALRARL